MSQISDPISSEIFARKPYLQNYFKPYPSLGRWEWAEAKKPGEYYVSLDGQAMASVVSPKTQAERTKESFLIRNTDVVFLFGLGNPHLIQLVDESMLEGQILVLLGDDPNLVPTLWEPVLKSVLSKPGRHIFSGEVFFPLLFNYLESLPIDRLAGVKSLKNPSDTKRSMIFRELEEKIQTIFSAKMSDLLTKFEFERLWIKNSIWNLVFTQYGQMKCFPISQLQDFFKERSAVLVSAGPSLRKSMPWLQSVRNKVFILSCDTSLKVLLKAGIIADGVVTLDAQTNSYFHFMGESCQKIPLFADLVSSPTLLRENFFSTVVHSVTAKYQVEAEGNLVREVTAGGELANYVFENLGDIQSGGSVATTAFDMLRFLGFKRIFFLGQDLAYTGREIHSTGTHHNEKWLTQVSRKKGLEHINETIIRKRETRYVESNSSGVVLTDYVLDLYRHWFEESSQSVENLQLYNINEHGAKISGIPAITEVEAWQFLTKEEEHNFFWYRHPIWNSQDKSKNLNQVPSGSHRLYQKIQEDLKYIESEIVSFETQTRDENLDFQKSDLWEWLRKETYLRRLVRKTEIYLLRHQALETERKNLIILESLKREIRYLKRSLYPASELLSKNG